MENRWVAAEAERFVSEYGPVWGEPLALRTYTSRLIGQEGGLVLHGGGNTSVKGMQTTLLGESVPAIFIKASGRPLDRVEPGDHTALDLTALQRLLVLDALDDEEMVNELRIRQFYAHAPFPSIEALLHAFLPFRFVDHTHADAILALSNRMDGERLMRQALGDEILILPYVRSGFALAKATSKLLSAYPQAKGMVLRHHGLLTWGETAQESYEATIALVNRAESFLEGRKTRHYTPARLALTEEQAWSRYQQRAPILRGLLARCQAEPEQRSIILKPLITPEILALLAAQGGRDLFLTTPLTADHLIHTKPLPLWVEEGEDLTAAVQGYVRHYQAYLERHRASWPPGMEPADPLPRIIALADVGVVCVAEEVEEAEILREITQHNLAVKELIFATDASYSGLGEHHLFEMEYLPMQQAKRKRKDNAPLRGKVAVVTGAAGAIGSGICRQLLENGCCVAVTDLPGTGLDSLTTSLQSRFGRSVVGIPLDVTDPAAVAAGFAQVVRAWGGIDLLVINAGIAHVSSLATMDLARFRQLVQVNLVGTLLMLSEGARHFKQQGCGGDVVLISTKNVFAPGASFGAYSATKSAAHQLARVASLELAELDVRVNMVAPDAVFSDGERKSGLWAEVGPDRMRARGLDEEGLEAYYRNRNLLKAKVTADHVANAVLFFATRQTPTTGATLPVDGGLPDATPR